MKFKYTRGMKCIGHDRVWISHEVLGMKKVFTFLKAIAIGESYDTVMGKMLSFPLKSNVCKHRVIPFLCNNGFELEKGIFG